MSEPETPRPPDDRELEALLSRRGEMSQRYREASTERAPDALDAKVLADAAGELRHAKEVAKAARWSSWRIPLTVAASLMLVFSFVRFGYHSGFVSEPTEESAAVEQAETQPASVPPPPESPAPPPASEPVAGAPAAKPQAFDKLEQPAPAPAPAPARVAAAKERSTASTGAAVGNIEQRRDEALLAKEQATTTPAPPPAMQVPAAANEMAKEAKPIADQREADAQMAAASRADQARAFAPVESAPPATLGLARKSAAPAAQPALSANAPLGALPPAPPMLATSEQMQACAHADTLSDAARHAYPPPAPWYEGIHSLRETDAAAARLQLTCLRALYPGFVPPN